MCSNFLRLDTILQRLTPSLAHLTGCSIIDFNPGVGLWSTKLHDVLKPKSHVLVEQDQNFYLPFLEPLLNAPGSRYHLRSWDEKETWRPDSYIAEGLIQELEKTTTTDGRNDSLLIIANLAYGRRKRIRGLSPSHRKIHAYINHIRSQRAFQAHGSVRLLMWMPDSDKSLLLPKTVSHRKKLSIGLDMTCNVEEIAGGETDSQITILREAFLEIESSKRVAERMEKQDIQIPFGRQDLAIKQMYEDVLSPADDNDQSLKGDLLTMTGARRIWHSELKQLDQDFRDGKFSRRPPSPSPTWEPPKNCRKERSREFYRLCMLKGQFKLQDKIRVKVDDLFQEQEAIDRLHASVVNRALNEPERQGKLLEFQRRAKALKDRIEDLPKKFRVVFNNNTDNRRALMKDPPLLMWDRRTAEPLIVREDEFYDPTKLALLDFQPLSPHPFPITSAQSAMFDLIIEGLWNQPDNSIYGLNTLAPCAADAIIPQVPALQDTQRGGRYDLSELRIRCFTPEMMYEIFQAWDKWPFKPQISEMASMIEEL